MGAVHTQIFPNQVDEKTPPLYREDLEQHAALVNKRMDEVFSPVYADLNFSIRGEKGSLKRHHDEWAQWTPLFEKRVVNTLLPLLEKYLRLVGFL